MDNVETHKTFNNKQVISLLGTVIFTTFSLTSIYNKFIFNDEEIQLNKNQIELNDIKVNERIDKKTKRNSDAIQFNLEAIRSLQQNGSDEEK